MGRRLAPLDPPPARVAYRPDALVAAEEALRLARLEPERARSVALEALEALEVLEALDGDTAADSRHSPHHTKAAEVTAVAELALGLVARELNDVAAATSHLRRSVDVAVSGGLRVRAAQARMSLALALAYGGRSQEALREADLAAPALDPVDRARLDMQRGLILQRLGRLDEALERYREALPVTRRMGDRHGEALLLMNRGVLQAYRGAFVAAEADLNRAIGIFDQLGRALYAAKTRHNLGYVIARSGDIPRALQWYDRAETEYRRLGISEAIGLLDRCEALLSVRLVPEAVAAARRAVQQFEASGMEADLAQGRLLLAQAALLGGDAAESARLARLAQCSFLEQERPGWAALAGHAWLRAAWSGGDRSPTMLEAAARAVDELLAAGWVGTAVDARLMTAQIALSQGLVQRAESELSAVSAARRSGPAELRARAWHAEALLRNARGDRRGTEAALRRGMTVLSEHQATLGATEVRVHAAARGQELAALGMRLALEDGRASRLLAWSERGRAGALRWPRALPPRDPEVAALLPELRHVVSLLEEKGFAAQDTAPLLRRQAQIEARIRRATWSAEGEHRTSGDSPPSVSVLSDALGEAVLVEMVEVDGELLALVVVKRRVSLHRLVRVDAVTAKVDALRFAIQRLARDRRAPASGAARAFLYGSEELDRLLLGPIRSLLGQRPLVVVPSGPCHALPWSTLPSLRGRPVSVAPSAALWLRAASVERPDRPRTVLVAGPGLAHGADEVSQLSRLYRRATTLTGPDATGPRLTSAVNGCDLAHIAAHGTFRADNPLFSSLWLFDGPMTVYDLERLRRIPRRIVLSACEAGQSVVTSSEELMGVSSALLSLGASTLVASAVAVSDEITKSLMVELHGNLLRGLGPAEALAGAQETLGDSDELRARTGGFVCFGAG